MTKVALLFGSTNEQGNTAGLISQLAEQVNFTQFNLHHYKMAPFQYSGQYDDDFRALFIELLAFDVIIFASPVYWYAPSGQMKLFMDRISDFLNHDKDYGRQLRGKSAAVVATGYDEQHPPCFEDIFTRTFNYLGMNNLGLAYQSCQTDAYQAADGAILSDLVNDLSNVNQMITS